MLRQCAELHVIETGYTPAATAHDGAGARLAISVRGFLYTNSNQMAHAGSVKCAYNPAGRLRYVGHGSAETRFLYDGAVIIAEYDVTGTVMHRYIHGPLDPKMLKGSRNHAGPR
jgi:hypothetical protein